jgi:hypothetical protein
MLFSHELFIVGMAISKILSVPNETLPRGATNHFAVPKKSSPQINSLQQI